MTESLRNKNIAALITSMYDVAAKFVAQSRAANALPGPQTCTPAALADHFSDLPGEHSVKPHMSVSSGGVNTSNLATGEAEFDYSPTVETPMDHSRLELHPGFPLHMPETYPFNFQGDYRTHHDGGGHGGGVVGPDVTWLAAAVQHGGTLPGASSVGMVGVGNGWEEWFWQNEQAGRGGSA
jgi:hypothetical protein